MNRCEAKRSGEAERVDAARTCTEQKRRFVNVDGTEPGRIDPFRRMGIGVVAACCVLETRVLGQGDVFETLPLRRRWAGTIVRPSVRPFGSRRGAWKTRRCKRIVGRVRVQASVDRRWRASRLRRSRPRRRAMAFERSSRPWICTNVPRATVRIFEPHKVHLTDGPGGPEGPETTVRLRSIRDPPRGDSIRHHRVGSGGVRGRATQAETPSTQRGTRSGRGGASSMPRDKRRRSRWTGVQGRI